MKKKNEKTPPIQTSTKKTLNEKIISSFSKNKFLLNFLDESKNDLGFEIDYIVDMDGGEVYNLAEVKEILNENKNQNNGIQENKRQKRNWKESKFKRGNK